MLAARIYQCTFSAFVFACTILTAIPSAMAQSIYAPDGSDEVLAQMASVVITRDAMQSNAFKDLVSLDVVPADDGRILHGFWPSDDKAVYFKPVVSEAKPIPKERLAVRTIYGNLIDLDEPHDFAAEPWK